MAGKRETALKNLEKADKIRGGRNSKKPRFSIKRSLQAKIEREGAEVTLSWIQYWYPEKYIDIIRDVLKGEIQTQLRIEGDVSGLGVILTYEPIVKKRES